MMKCPSCGSFDTNSWIYAVHVPGGRPPQRHECRKCGWFTVVPAVYPNAQSEEPPDPKVFESNVIQERDELKDRLAKLQAFLGTERFLKEFPQQQQVLMYTQMGLMQGYLNVLNKRIELLPCDPTN